MSEPHRIHLRGHWKVDGDRRTRSFGRPRLPAGERVWLVVDGLGDQVAVELNGQPIGSARHEITETLLERNTLSVSTANVEFAVHLEISS